MADTRVNLLRLHRTPVTHSVQIAPLDLRCQVTSTHHLLRCVVKHLSHGVVQRNPHPSIARVAARAPEVDEPLQRFTDTAHRLYGSREVCARRRIEEAVDPRLPGLAPTHEHEARIGEWNLPHQKSYGEDPEDLEALRQLTPRRRLVVFLRYFADLSYAEIASLLEISEGTVAATLAHAHADLESTLSEKEAAR